jgi:sporulation protein YlmC with PRC-barrel domain
MVTDKVGTRKMIGRVIVSEETGKRFGVVGDLNFISESGELMNLIVSEPTRSISDLGLQEDEQGRPLVPFSAVKSVGDFVIISERDMA